MNLLDRAKRLLQGQGAGASQKTQYFNVLCPDGHRISGARNEGYQALRCPSCGEGVFVLPRSPLPDVPALPKPAAKRPRRVAAAPAVLDEPIALSDPPPLPPRDENEQFTDIDWEEPEAPSPQPEPSAAGEPAGRSKNGTTSPPARPERRPARAARSVSTGAARQERTERRRPAQTPAAPSPEPEPAFDARDWLRRHRNPLIFAAVGLLLVATVGFRAWRSQFQDYPRLAELGRTEGLKALDAGEWDKAHQLLSRAKRAVDALGGKVQGAEEIRHGADEAALYASLVSDTLETLLETADPAEGSGWPRQFDALYKGKAIIVRAEVMTVPGADGKGEYDLDYRVFPAGEGDLQRRRDVRIGRLDLTGFKLFQDLQPKRGTEIAFGARLRSFAFDPERNEWLVGLEPDSGVILQHQDALAAAFLTAGAETPPEEGKP